MENLKLTYQAPDVRVTHVHFEGMLCGSNLVYGYKGKSGYDILEDDIIYEGDF